MKKLLDNMERVNAKVQEITKELKDIGYVIHHTAWAAVICIETNGLLPSIHMNRVNLTESP